MPSFYFDTNGLLTNAASIFNGLGSIIIPIIGISAGIGLLFKVASEIKSVFNGRR